MIRRQIQAAIVGLVVWLAGAQSSIRAEALKFQGTIVPDQSGKVITVAGSVDPKLLDDTLMHEHIFIDYRHGKPESEALLERWNTPFSARTRSQFYTTFVGAGEAFVSDKLNDAIDEVMLYKGLGGKTIVDVTPINLGRQPAKMQKVAAETGLNMIMATGFYHGPYLPKNMDQLSIDELTLILLGELTTGINGTKVRAGIIGEVAADNFTLTPKESNEVRSLRASARASRLSGAAISLHGDPLRPQVWHTILDILEEEGADLSRVVMGHVGAIAAADSLFLESLLARGVYLQFDMLGWPPVPMSPIADQRPMLDAIVDLTANGHSRRIVVSQDSFTKAHQAKYGGWGLTFIHTALIPYLRSKNVSDRAIRHIVEENPRRILTFVQPQKLLEGQQ